MSSARSKNRLARPLHLEALEKRLLLAITLTNGLPSTDPDYFAVELEAGGAAQDAQLGDIDTIQDYLGYLDTGNAVYNLLDHASEPVMEADRAVSTATLATPSGSVEVRVESYIPAGSRTLVNEYEFTATDFDLREARFWQYLDGHVVDIDDDILTVDGSVDDQDLLLTTIDPMTGIEQAQGIGSPMQNASATGWAADKFADLQDDIEDGGFDAAADGTVDTTDLPEGIFVIYGAGYGPGNATTAIEFTFSAEDTATVTTTLDLEPEETVPSTGWQGFADPLVNEIGNGQISSNVGDFNEDDRPDIFLTESDSVHLLFGSQPERTFQWYGTSYHVDDDESDDEVPPDKRIGHPSVEPDGTVSFWESYMQPRVGGPAVIGHYYGDDGFVDAVTVVEGGLTLLRNDTYPEQELSGAGEPYSAYDVDYSPRHNLYVQDVGDLISPVTDDPHVIEAIAPVQQHGGRGVIVVTSTEGDEQVLFVPISNGTIGDFAELPSDDVGGPVGGGFSDVVTADYDADGDLDVFAIDFDNNILVWYNYNSQNQTYAVQPNIELNPDSDLTDGPVSIIVTDLDNDDLPDLVIANEFGEQSGRHLTILYNTDGGWSEPVPVNINFDGRRDIPKVLGYGDFNEDDNDDIIVGNAVRGELIVLLGTGETGTADQSPFFDSQVISLGQNVPIQDIAVLTGLEWRADDGDQELPAERPNGVDMNADGHADIIVITPNTAYTLLNLGFDTAEGNTEPFGRLQEPYEDTYYDFTDGVTTRSPGWTLPFDDPTLSTLIDLNGDGWGDIVVDNAADDTVGVYLTSGPQSYQEPEYYSGLSSTVTGLIGGDFLPEEEDEEVVNELIAVYAGQDLIQVFENDGNGLLTPGPTFTLTNPIGMPVAADVNRDGLLDLVSLSQGNQVTVLLNNSAASVSFNDGSPMLVPLTNAGVVDLAVGRLTDDRYPDLLVGHSGAGPTVLENTSGGAFDEILINGLSSRHVAAGDFDDDGFDDVAFYEAEAQAVFIYVHDGTGGYIPASPSFVPVAGVVRDLASPDLDRDDVDDLLVLRRKLKQFPDDPDELTLVTLLSNQNATFGSPTQFDLETAADMFAVGDLNADLYSDVVAISRPDGDPVEGIEVVYVHSTEHIEINWTDWATTSKEPFHVALGDVDGDGDQDVIVGNEAGRSVSVYTNDGGLLATPVDYAGPELPVKGIGLGDFDNDGDLDIIAHYADTNLIGVYLNDGAGGFGDTDALPARLFSNAALADPEGEFAVADLDGDGFADFALADASGAVVFMANNGNLTFSAATTVNIGDGIVGVHLVDVDTDDVRDLVVVRDSSDDADDGLYIYTGAGGFAFNPPVEPPAGSEDLFPPPVIIPVNNPADVAFGDVDGDGYTDIAAIDGLQNMVRAWLWSDVDAAFNAIEDDDPVLLASVALALELADMDGDGAADAVVVTESDEQPVSLLLSEGDGGFAEPALFDAANRPVAMAMADLDQDPGQVPDLLLVGGGGPAVLDGVDTGEFEEPRQYSALRVDDPGAVVDIYYYTAYDPHPVHVGGPFPVGDDDNTFIWNSGNPRIRTVAGPALFVNDGSAAYNVPVQYDAGDSQPQHVRMGDLDGDGDNDVVVGNAAGSISVYLNDAGVLQEPTQFDLSPGRLLSSITLVDMNDDGILDVAAVMSGQNSIALFEGMGTGAFGPVQEIEVGTVPQGDLVPADFDQDGLMDLAFITDTFRVAIVLQTAGGGFAAPEELGYERQVGSLAATDLDGDNIPDLVVGVNDLNTAVDTAYIYTADWFTLLQADDELTPGQYAVENPVHIETGDIDNDGDVDVVTIGDLGTASNFTILTGNGTGDFTRHVPAATLNAPAQSFRMRDLNSDGLLDLVALTLDPQEPVNVFVNQDGLTFGDMQPLTANNSPVDLDVADLTGDGAPEVVAVGTSSTFATLAAPDYLYEGGNEVYFRMVVTESDDDVAWDDAITPVRIGAGAFWNGTDEDLVLDAGINPHTLVQRDMDNDDVMDLVTMGEHGQLFNVFYGMKDWLNSGWSGPLFYDAPNSDWAEFVPYAIYDVDAVDANANGGWDALIDFYLGVDSMARVYQRNDSNEFYYDLGQITMGSSPTDDYPVFEGLNIDMPYNGLTGEGELDYFRFRLGGDVSDNDTLDIMWDPSEGTLEATVTGSNFALVEPGHLSADLSDLDGGVRTLLVKGESFDFWGSSVDVVSDYTISFTPNGPEDAGDPDDYEANNDRASATQLNVINGPNVYRRLNMTNEGSDWYVFDLDHMPLSDENVRIEFDHDFGDLDLQAFQYDGAQVTWSRAQFTEQDEEFISLLGASPNEPVYIHVSGDTNLDGYTLSVNLPGIESDRYEGNNLQPAFPFGGLSNLNILPNVDVGELDAVRGLSTYLGQIAGQFSIEDLTLTPGDTDWFHFYVMQPTTAAGEDYSITVYYDDRGGEANVNIYDREGSWEAPGLPGSVVSSIPVRGYDPVRDMSFITFDVDFDDRDEYFMYVYAESGQGVASISDYEIEFDLETNRAASFDAGDVDASFDPLTWFDDLFPERYTSNQGVRNGYVANLFAPLPIPAEGPVPIPRQGNFYEEVPDIVVAEGQPSSAFDQSRALFLWGSPQREWWGYNMKNDLTNEVNPFTPLINADAPDSTSLLQVAVIDEDHNNVFVNSDGQDLWPEEVDIDWYPDHTSDIPDTSIVNFVQVYDLDEDGLNDVVAANTNENRIDVLWNYNLSTIFEDDAGPTTGAIHNPGRATAGSGAANYNQAITSYYHRIIEDPRGPADGVQDPIHFWLGDLNELLTSSTWDPFEDIVVAAPGSQEVWVIEGSVNDQGVWSPRTQKTYPVGFEPTMIQVAELDGWALGDEAFDWNAMVQMTPTLNEDWDELSPNDDGDLLLLDEPEIIAVDRLNGYVSILRGHGENSNPTFENAWIQTVGRRPLDVAYGDFNQDLLPDLAVVNSYFGDSSVSMLWGNRNEHDVRPYGQFEFDWNTPVTIPRDSTVDWQFWQGAWMDPTNDWGTLQYDRSWQVGHYDEAVQIEAGLWDLDGLPDMAVLDRFSGELIVGLNNSRNPAIEIDKDPYGWIWNPWFPSPAQRYNVPNRLAALDTLEIRWRVYDAYTQYYGSEGANSTTRFFWDLDNNPSNGYGGIIDGIEYDGLIDVIPPGTGKAWLDYTYWSWQVPWYLAGEDIWIVGEYYGEQGGWDLDYLNPERPIEVAEDVPTIRLNEVEVQSLTIGDMVDIQFEFLIPPGEGTNINLYYDFDMNPWNEGDAYTDDQILYPQGDSDVLVQPLSSGPRLIATNDAELADSLQGVGFIDLAQVPQDQAQSGVYTYTWTVSPEIFPDLLAQIDPELTLDQIDEVAGKSLWFFGVINNLGDEAYQDNGMPKVGPDDFAEISEHWRSDYTGAPMQVYPDDIISNIPGMTGVENQNSQLPFVRMRDLPPDVLRLSTRPEEMTEYRIAADLPLELRWWDALPANSRVSLFYDEYPNRNFEDGVNWIVQNLDPDATPDQLTPHTIDRAGAFQWDVPVDLIEEVIYIGAYVEILDNNGQVIATDYDYMRLPARVTAPWRWSGPEVSDFVAAHSETWVVSSDFDGDGHLDIAMTSAVQGDLAIYSGTGTGDFTLDNGQVFNLGASGFSLAIGDFWSPDTDADGNWIPDGKPDLIASVGPQTPGTDEEAKLVIFGNVSEPGMINFLDPYNPALFPDGQPVQELLPEDARPEGIKTILPATYMESTDTWETGEFMPGSYDLNRDGYTDLVAMDLVKLETNPAAQGAFEYTPELPVMIVRYGDPENPGRFYEVDPAEDDLIRISEVDWVWQREDPETGEAYPILMIVPYAGRMAQIMDVNNDKWPDVAVAIDEGFSQKSRQGVSISDSKGSESVQLLMNDRQGQLTRFFPLPGGQELSHPRWAGSFLWERVNSVDQHSHILAIEQNDFNEDGIRDIVVTTHEMDRSVEPQLDWYTMVVYLGQGDGRYGESINHDELDRYEFVDWHFTEAEPRFIATGDFDRDGYIDVMVLCHDDDSAMFFKGRGDGTFEEGISYDAGKFPTAAAVGDFNEDGWTDLVVSNEADRGISPLLNANRQYTPVIVLEEPDFLFVPEGAPLDIVWRDADDDSDATIRLFWDDDTNRNNGLTEIPTVNTIFESIDGVEIEDVYTWVVDHPSFFPGKQIFLHAQITDGVDTTWDTLETPLTIIDPDEAFIAVKGYDGDRVAYNDGIEINWFDNDDDDSDDIVLYINEVPINDGTETPIVNGIIPEDLDGQFDTLLWTNGAESINGTTLLQNNVIPEDYLNAGPVFIGANISNATESMWSWITNPITIIATPEIDNFQVDDRIDPGLPGLQVGTPQISMSVQAVDNDSDYTVTFFWDDDTNSSAVNALQTLNQNAPAAPLPLDDSSTWPTVNFDWADADDIRELVGQEVWFGAIIESEGDRQVIYNDEPALVLPLDPEIELTGPDPNVVASLPSGNTIDISWRDSYYAYYDDPVTDVNIDLYWEDADNPGPRMLITPTPIVEQHTIDQTVYTGSYTWLVSGVPQNINLWANLYDPNDPATEDWDDLGPFSVTLAPEVDDVLVTPTTIYPGSDATIAFDYRDQDGDVPVFSAWFDPGFDGQLSGQAIQIAADQPLPASVDWTEHSFTWTTPAPVDGPIDGVVFVQVTTPDGLQGSDVSATATIQDDPEIAFEAGLATTLEPGADYQIDWSYTDNDSADNVNLYYSFRGAFDGSQTLITPTPLSVAQGSGTGTYTWAVPETVEIAEQDQLFVLVEILDPTAPGNPNARDTDVSPAVTIEDPPVITNITAGTEAIMGETFPISFTAEDIDTFTPALYWDIDQNPNNGFGDGTTSGLIAALPDTSGSETFNVDWVVNVPSSVVGSNIYFAAYAEDNNTSTVEYSSSAYVDDVPEIEINDFGEGFQWIAGEVLTVNWMAEDVDADATIDLYWDSNTDPADNTPETEGESWGTIATGLSEDAQSSYDWTVPIDLFSMDVYLYATITDANGLVQTHSGSDYTENTIEVLKGNVPTLIAQRQVDRLLISIYDTGVDDPADSKIGIAWDRSEFNQWTTDVLIAGSGRNDRVIRSIELYNNPENIGIVIEGTGIVHQVTDRRSDLLRPIGFVASQAQVGQVFLRGPVEGWDFNAMQLGDRWTMPYDIDGDGDALDAVGLYLAAPTETRLVRIMDDLGADLATETHLYSLMLTDVVDDADISIRGDLQVARGNDVFGDTRLRSFGGNINVALFNTWQAGAIEAQNIRVLQTRGALGADVNVFSGHDSALTLVTGDTLSGNVTHNLDIRGIIVRDGDVTGDINAYSLSRLVVSRGGIRDANINVTTDIGLIVTADDIANANLAARDMNAVIVRSGDFTAQVQAQSLARLLVSTGSIRNSNINVTNLLRDVMTGEDLADSNVTAGELSRITVRGLVSGDGTHEVTADEGTFQISDQAHPLTTIGTEPVIWNGVRLEVEDDD